METPSEWAKRFNRQKTDEEAGLPSPEAESADIPAPATEFPSEPFQCPACGQLLAPSCRVCVACKHPIDPAELARPLAAVSPVAPAPETGTRRESVRYPWRLFLAVIGVGLILGLISLALWGDQKGPLMIQAIPILAGLWVFFDALRRRIPRPLRWGLGTMLLLAIIFPWYLARRSKPESSVPFVEAEVGPVTRVLLIALLLFFLAGLILNIVQGPRPTTGPSPTPRPQKTGGSSPSRITDLRLWKAGGRRTRQGEGSLPAPGESSAQAVTNAPADARQT